MESGKWKVESGIIKSINLNEYIKVFNNLIFPKNNFFKLTIDKNIGIKPFFSIVKYKIIVKGKLIKCKNSEFDVLILLLIIKNYCPCFT